MKRSTFGLSLLVGTMLSSACIMAAHAEDKKPVEKKTEKLSDKPVKKAVEKAMVANSPAAVVVPPVAAEAVARGVVSNLLPSSGCTMKERVTISVRHNFKAGSFAEAKKVFDERNAQVEQFAKKQKLSINLYSQNYNINSQPQNYGPDGMPQSFQYSVSGNTSYRMNDSDLAFKFGEFLTSKNIQVNLSSSSHRQGNCNY